MDENAEEKEKFKEEQFILRVPNELAGQIRERIRTENFEGLELDLPSELFRQIVFLLYHMHFVL